MAIMEIAGRDGLLHIADRFGKALQDGVEDLPVDSVVWTAEKRFGEDYVESLFTNQALTNGDLRAFRDAIQNRPSSVPDVWPASTNDLRALSFDQIPDWLFLDSSLHGRLMLGRWGRNASASELLNAARALVDCTEIERTRQLLKIFGDREFPLGADTLIDLAASADRDLRIASLCALVNMGGSAVRALALELVESNEHLYHACRMLAENYEEGDEVSVLEALELCNDADELGGASHGLLYICDLEDSVEPERALHWIYDRGPSSNTRYSAIELLIELGRIPQWMVNECLLDCNPHTRELVR
jgi:hypothetical protein